MEVARYIYFECHFKWFMVNNETEDMFEVTIFRQFRHSDDIRKCLINWKIKMSKYSHCSGWHNIYDKWIIVRDTSHAFAIAFSVPSVQLKWRNVLKCALVRKQFIHLNLCPIKIIRTSSMPRGEWEVSSVNVYLDFGKCLAHRKSLISGLSISVDCIFSPQDRHWPQAHCWI